MSTRATYEFNGKQHPRTTFYIHHDGYPEGAATYYLLPAIERGSRDATLAEAFLRANDKGEFTDGHRAHGDTEYRYTIDTDKMRIRVEARSYYDPNGNPAAHRWGLSYEGPLADFIEAQTGQKLREKHGRLWTAAMAKAYAEAKRAEATSYAERFPMYTGNIASGNAEADRAEQFAAEFGQQKAA